MAYWVFLVVNIWFNYHALHAANYLGVILVKSQLHIGLIEQLKKYRGHNLYLETLAETGILGLAAFLAIILAIMHGLWKIWKKLQHEDSESSDVAMAFFLCLVAYLISAIFAHMSYQRYFWLLMALSSATIHILGSVEHEIPGELGPA